jgi:hypothetical protein
MDPLIRNIEMVIRKSIPFPIKLFFRKSLWMGLYANLIIRNFIKFSKNQELVYCPISEKHYAGFIPIYRKSNKNMDIHHKTMISPYTGAREGLRLQWLYLKNETELFSMPQKLLHFAPEYCYYEKFRKMRNIDYFPVDKNNQKYGSGILFADIENLQYPENTFNMIICNHILEHVDDDIKSIKEMYRVLVPGGIGIITVPINESRDYTIEDPTITSPKERERLFGQWDHTRYYGLDLLDRLASPGFKVEKVNYSRKFTQDEFVKYGLADELIFVIKKPK